MARKKSECRSLCSQLKAAENKAKKLAETLAAEKLAETLVAEKLAETHAAEDHRRSLVAAFFSTEAALKATRVASGACTRAHSHLNVLRKKINAAHTHGDQCLDSRRAKAYDFEAIAYCFEEDVQFVFNATYHAVNEARIEPREYVTSCSHFENLRLLLDAATLAEEDAQDAGYDSDDCQYNACDDTPALKANAAALGAYAKIAAETGLIYVYRNFTVSAAIAQSLQLFRLAGCAEAMARAAKTHDEDALEKAAKTAKEAIIMAKIADEAAEAAAMENATPADIAYSKAVHCAAIAAKAAAVSHSLCAKLRPIHGELVLGRKISE